MMIQRAEAEELLKKYVEGVATDEERALLESWYLKHELTGLPEANVIKKQVQLEQVRLNLLAHSNITKRLIKPAPVWPRLAIAASVLLFTCFGIYFMLYKPGAKQAVAQNTVQDIAPGTDKAVLTLASGKQINIGINTTSGLLAYQGNTKINLKAGKEVVYSADGGTNTDTKIPYNTLSTPRGAQYPLVLSDGTRVWLDAASSITFPVSFTGNSREVKIAGQVYFEVAHNVAKPFKVTAAGQTVEVLGTHFNINAYPDEHVIKTTLFEGSIKISTPDNKAVLKPGQQAQISDSKISVNENADLDEALAWHHGLFQFHDADIQTVMRQLCRWYNVDVSYEGKVTNRQFSGKIYRNNSALKVSELLSYKQIHFRIEGKKIIVMP